MRWMRQRLGPAVPRAPDAGTNAELQHGDGTLPALLATDFFAFAMLTSHSVLNNAPYTAVPRGRAGISNRFSKD